MNLFLGKGERKTQAGFIALLELRKPWVERFMVLNGRTIPVVRRELTRSDRWGSLKARWGIGRMGYSVLPGLYAAGNPGAESAVFVTANYKMSFDALRGNLSGIDAWILVLDTAGINVWCAAGKGTFGTDELVSRISSVRLDEIVSHRELILPQLGASGVSAPQTAKRSGFRIIWGPVRAEDIQAWFTSGRIKNGAMGEVTFTLKERMAVAPVEIVHSWPLVLAAPVLGTLYGLPLDEGWPGRALPVIAVLLGTIPVGTILFPALLPWLPHRAFAFKGAVLGAIWASIVVFLFRLPPLAVVSAILISASITAFLAMNFTGASTFTSQGGALLEVEKGFFPMTGTIIAGLAVALASRLLNL